MLPSSRKRKSGCLKGLKKRIWFLLHGTALEAPCHWCKRLWKFSLMTVDHEPPLAEGGSNASVVLACCSCNTRRGMETRKKMSMKRRERACQNAAADTAERGRQMAPRRGSAEAADQR